MLTTHNESHNAIAPMSDKAIEYVRDIEAKAMNMAQVDLQTTHTFHAGVYARTIKLPAGVILTGALIKIPTLVIVSGYALIYHEHDTITVDGYETFQAEANRKQAFVAVKDTYITMTFATNATTIEEAEQEFTDETHLLLTNRKGK